MGSVLSYFVSCINNRLKSCHGHFFYFYVDETVIYFCVKYITEKTYAFTGSRNRPQNIPLVVTIEEGDKEVINSSLPGEIVEAKLGIYTMIN